MVTISGKQAIAIAVVAVIFVGVYGAFTWAIISEWTPPWVPPTTITEIPPETEYAQMKYTGVQKDATGTTVTSATTRIWFDADADGFMDYDEIGTFSESSGVYTTAKEYPINIAPCAAYPDGVEFDLWVQVYATGYQVTYEKCYMTGARYANEAKNYGNIELIKTDTGVTYDGEINDVAWDDSTDYNATLSGTSGEAEVKIVLSAADMGLSNQIWEDVDYETIYGVTRDLDFYVKWDEITEEGIADASVMAPDFFGLTMTIANKVLLKPAVTDFDHYGDDDTNWYGLVIVSDAMGDLFYNSQDTSAPKPSVKFDVGVISATGSTLGTEYGVVCWHSLTYEQMVSFQWTAAAGYVHGTGGNDWDWTVV